MKPQGFDSCYWLICYQTASRNLGNKVTKNAVTVHSPGRWFIEKLAEDQSVVLLSATPLTREQFMELRNSPLLK